MSELCYGCMNEHNSGDICPDCGFDNNSFQVPPYLPLGTVLQDRYVVGKFLKQTTESVKYIGFDKSARSRVTIVEFMPESMCERLSGNRILSVFPEKERIFRTLENEFLEMYRNVARFKDLSAIVPVYDIFSENKTSYAVEDMEEDIPFEEYISRRGGFLQWDTARPLFMPVLSSLSKIHKSGFGHFGVCPKNLVITPSGKMRITNFAIKQVHQVGHGIKPMISSGCSAPEQYRDNEPLTEDTDVYGFTATLFYALTGNLPADARKRLNDGRLLINTNIVKRLPPHVVSALANGLQVDRNNRIKDFELLRAQLSAAPTVNAIQEEIARPAVIIEDETPVRKRKIMTNRKWMIASLSVALVIFSVIGVFWLNTDPFSDLFKTPISTPGGEDSTDATSENGTYDDDSQYTRVPDFTKMTLESAKSEAEMSNGRYYVYKEVEEKFSDDVAEGLIMEQSPQANSTVNKGNDGVSISVVISKGPKVRKLPEITVGMSKEDATTALIEAGFIPTASYEFSDSVNENCIVRYGTSLEAGQEYEYGTEINVVISKGNRPLQTG